ncbi:MAG TPA: phosphoribosylglycinamide formyltransferase [Candidatus Polarisedimenticolaceae bacterium]|nr:phosphoribosylglycinamide formyltransferase [Candidatus Polarisedimenticolaceae bacterium]
MSTSGRVGILISGRGSNMVALIEAMQRGEIAAETAIVISNRPDAGGLARARALGVMTRVVDSGVVKPRKLHEQRVIELLREQRVDLVCLAGYMRLLSAGMVAEFRQRILNIHPSLLPAFPGLDAQRQALDYGVRFTGCTVHFVDEACDHGPIVLQAAVPVEPDDDEARLSARILEQEHRLYVRAVRLFFDQRLEIDGRRVTIAGGVS